MPERRRIWGEPMAPAERTTSRLALGGALGAALLVGHTCDPAAVEQQSLGQRVGLDLQIGPALGRGQVGLGRAAAEAVADGELEVGDTLLAGAVVVRVLGNAGLLGRLDEGVHQLHPGQRLGHVQGPAPAAIGVLAAGKALRLLEEGKNVLVGPADIAELAPMVVVERLAADIGEAVDRGAAAQHLAARPGDRAAVDAGLGLGLEAPADLGIVDRPVVADRQMDPEIAIGGPSLEEQDAHGWVFGKTGGDGASGRAGTYDDVVELLARLLFAHAAQPLPVRGPGSWRRRSGRSTRDQGRRTIPRRA